jgi:phage terminase large subunit-like protein
MIEPRPTLGFGVCDWIEDNLVHGPGPVQGDPIVLDDEFRAFILRAYELRPDGARAYRRCFLSRAKGRGKSELAAMLACAELLGPVRLDRWEDSEPIGTPVIAPEILCFATEEQQAGLVFRAALYMLTHGPVAERYDLDAGLTRVYLPDGGVLMPVSAAAPSKEGARSTMVVLDETHLWNTPQLRELHATVRRNLAKHPSGEAWALEVSTAPAAGGQDVATGTLAYGRELAERGAADPELLIDSLAARGGHALDTFDGRLGALREAYGAAASWVPLARIAAEFDDPQNTRQDWERYFLNRVTALADAWLDPAAWDQCAHPDRSLEPGDRVTLGFDGSFSRDGTALVACRVTDGHLALLHLQEPAGERRAAGEEVDRQAVDAAVHEAVETYRVIRFYADPWFWQDSVSRWEQEFRRSRVRAWPTNRVAPMVNAVGRFETAVYSGELSHGGDPRLARHVANARKRERRGGHVIEKEAPGSWRRIDAAVAAVLAYEARGDAIASGEARERSRMLYSF